MYNNWHNSVAVSHMTQSINCSEKGERRENGCKRGLNLSFLALNHRKHRISRTSKGAAWSQLAREDLVHRSAGAVESCAKTTEHTFPWCSEGAF